MQAMWINVSPFGAHEKTKFENIEELTITMAFLKDASKPEGEACSPDGTLKDADMIEWLNSPSDLVPPSLENFSKHVIDYEIDDDDAPVIKRRKVSYCWILGHRSETHLTLAAQKSNTAFPSADKKFTNNTENTVGLADTGTTGEDAVDEAIGEAEAGNTKEWEWRWRSGGDEAILSRSWRFKKKNISDRLPWIGTLSPQNLVCRYSDI